MSESAWEPLPMAERRILGVLVEKQKTSKTADSYPLTLNSLTTGCNQKSNRDPVLDLTEDEVEESLSSLQKKGYVTRLTGSRVDRFKHELYERWTPNGPQLAVLAELLLRGPQTKGELRGRASRMAPIDTLEALDEVLQPLVERKLVVWLADPDRRGATLTHGFHTPEELANARTAGPAPEPAPRSAPTDMDRRLADAEDRITSLEAAVAALQTRLESGSPT
jgi:uncharacterized protein YceH (UPF0502 family)